MTRRAATSLLLLFLLSMVGCDHATKVAAKSALEGARPLDVWAGIVDLRYVENQDVAFSLTRSIESPAKAVVLVAFAAIATTALLAYAWRRRHEARAIERAALALVLAGAVANAIDRAARGYVIDFIHVRYWPVFNVADVLIVVGAILLVASSVGRGFEDRPRAPS